jgi:hypothetical protein
MTLDRFFEKDSLKWTDSHVQKLREEWEKMKTHKLFAFNKEWYIGVFEKCNPKTLEYYVSLKIPYFSEWADNVLHGDDS